MRQLCFCRGWLGKSDESKEHVSYNERVPARELCSAPFRHACSNNVTLVV